MYQNSFIVIFIEFKIKNIIGYCSIKYTLSHSLVKSSNKEYTLKIGKHTFIR